MHVNYKEQWIVEDVFPSLHGTRHVPSHTCLSATLKNLGGGRMVIAGTLENLKTKKKTPQKTEGRGSSAVC